MKNLVNIVVRKYKEETKAADIYYGDYIAEKSDIAHKLWLEHANTRWILREVLIEYGYTPEELDIIEMEEE